MIGGIKGKPQNSHKGSVLIETSGGISYLINVKDNTLKNIISKKEIYLHTHTIVRNNSIELFGFLTWEEYTCFLLLISVSGIGPKSALNILNNLESQTLLSYIKKGDIDSMVTYKINKKTAQKLIIELQPKIKSDISSQNPLTQDVVNALATLGYSKNTVIEILKNHPMDSASLEKQIQTILRIINKNAP